MKATMCHTNSPLFHHHKRKVNFLGNFVHWIVCCLRFGFDWVFEGCLPRKDFCKKEVEKRAHFWTLLCCLTFHQIQIPFSIRKQLFWLRLHFQYFFVTSFFFWRHCRAKNAFALNFNRKTFSVQQKLWKLKAQTFVLLSLTAKKKSLRHTAMKYTKKKSF